MLQETANKCILSICDISPSRCGSFEEFLISLTEKLREERLRHVIVFREKPIIIVEKALLEKGAEIKIFKPSKHNIFNFLPLYFIIKKTKPDIVHFHFYPVYTIINYLVAFFKISIIYTDHMGSPKKAKTFLKKMIRRIYYNMNSKLFDFGIRNIVCVSNFVKEKYSKEYGIYSNKFCIIYNGVNTKRFKKIHNTEKIREQYNIKDEFVVTCVGLRNEKGPRCLINAAPTIIKSFSNTKFILVGGGESRIELEKYINQLNLKDYFVFAGTTNHIEEIYSISSCVAIPTLGDEAFCFVAAEAMSTETPVIAFDSGALNEILYDKSKIIPSSFEILSKEILECLRNSGGPSTKNARKYVIKNFSLERSICDYIKLYQNLLR